MLGASEILIVMVGFAIPGLYVYFVSRYIRAAERETADAEARDRKGLPAA